MKQKKISPGDLIMINSNFFEVSHNNVAFKEFFDKPLLLLKKDKPVAFTHEDYVWLTFFVDGKTQSILVNYNEIHALEESYV